MRRKNSGTQFLIVATILALIVAGCRRLNERPPLVLYPSPTLAATITPLVVEITSTAAPTYTPEVIVMQVSLTPIQDRELCWLESF